MRLPRPACRPISVLLQAVAGATAFFIVFIRACAGAATVPTISLTDSIRDVLRTDNDAIRLQDEKVKTASSEVQQAAGQFDWAAQAQGGWQEIYVPRVGYSAAIPGKGILTNDTDILSAYYYSVSIGREFRNGIQIAPGLTAYPATSGATTAQTFGLTALRPSLGLRIPLLQGLGEEAADSAELAAKATLIGTHFDRDYAIAHTVHDMVQIYWRCLAAERVVDISAQSLRDGEAYSTSLELQAKRGLIEPSVAQAYGAANATRQITLEQNEDAVRSCQRDLAVATTGEAVGGTPAPTGQLPGMAGEESTVSSLNEAALDDLALNNRSDLKAAREYIAAALAAHRGAEDSTSPILSLQIDPTRAIVVYSQSLENNAAEGKVAQDLSSQRQAEVSLHQLETQVQVDITDSVRNLRSALAEWKASLKAEQETEIAVASDEKRARFGVIDRKTLLQTEDQLTQLKTDVVNAELQFASNMTMLRLVSGTVHPEQETPAASAALFMSLPDSG
ncbi:MAG TPA: TolC family protein [Rhizomicrobium sp.]|jgi:outer membrane protein TolC|nr:TolC family protein [Rhizomicrobium sp.]